ncbi:trypsin-like peptidase domain-containing protein [Mesorhizobium sp. M1148]|uniref:trypsin-like peptidase domain-containing protein n=1 Tax=unclassified Mesorhizobium TaxID=325217 RepID=UPI0003CE8C06|nr:trypsin-like peptidase domain-containing protein [Mesorhizobium sp. LSJC264A00]ESX23894.1 hypothetical protein X767_13625 [Mesorhizobium sp. LSJC264A00]
MAYLPDNNLNYPVHIQIGGSTGSGFHLRTETALWLITAKHVLFRADGTLYNNTAETTSFWAKFSARNLISLDLAVLTAAGSVRRHAAADVAAIKLMTIAAGAATGESDPGVTATIPQGSHLVGVNALETVLPFDEVGISNEAFLFGYPVSIGHAGQLEPDKPLIRRGAIAGLNEANRTIILDAPSYQGNSGGLVVECIDEVFERRFRAIGIAVAFVPFYEKMQSLHFKTVNTNIENSGYTIVEPIDKILETIA